MKTNYMHPHLVLAPPGAEFVIFRMAPALMGMVFLFDSSGTENAEAGSGMGVELLVDFGVGDVGKVLG